MFSVRMVSHDWTVKFITTMFNIKSNQHYHYIFMKTYYYIFKLLYY